MEMSTQSTSTITLQNFQYTRRNDCVHHQTLMTSQHHHNVTASYVDNDVMKMPVKQDILQMKASYQIYHADMKI